MDILTHTISGAFAGIVVAALSKKPQDSPKLIALGALAGFLPDIDVITLWSGFDESLGKFFHLTQSGKSIYISKLWYSHHSFFHSLLAILFYLFVMLLFTKKAPYFIAFAMGYTLHILEDLPTPDTIWHGVRVFYPYERYFGGYNYIWWWNNYDLFLIIASSFLATLSIHIFVKKAYQKYLVALIFSFAISLTLFQIKTRDLLFYQTKNKSYHQLEEESLKIQKKILGEKLFHLMQAFDKRLKIPF